MIIGEAWGKEEEKERKPFVGSAGKLLNDALEEAGIDREKDCYVTNVFQLRPPQNDPNFFFTTIPGEAFVHNRRYVKKEFYKELVRLFQEIKDVSPNLIVVLGNTPLWALTGEVGITQHRGKLINTKMGNILPICHPAFVIRGRTQRYPVFVQDFRLAKKLASQQDPFVYYQRELNKTPNATLGPFG